MRFRVTFGFALLTAASATILVGAVVFILRPQRLAIRDPVQTSDPAALLREANRLSWLGNWDAAGPLYERAEWLFRVTGARSGELQARIGRVRAQADGSSLAKATEILADELRNPAVLADPKLHLWCLAAKAHVDFDFDLSVAKDDWTEAQRLANSVGDRQWASRAHGELGVIAFLEGNTSDAASLLGNALLSAYETGDVAAKIEFLSLAGVGFDEESRFPEALSLFRHAISIAEKTPDGGYPYLAHEGEVAALLGLGKTTQARDVLAPVFAVAQAHNRKGEEALILILFGDASLADHNTEEAKAYFERAGLLFQEIQLYRGLDEAMFKLAGIYRQQGDLGRASSSLRIGLGASRRVGGQYYLPRALTALAELEAAEKHFRRADGRFRQAEHAMEGILDGLYSDYEVAAVAGTMSKTYVEHFRLVARQGHVARAFQILEQVRGRRAANLLGTLSDAAKQPPMLATLNSALGSTQLALLESEDPNKQGPMLDQFSGEAHGFGFATNHVGARHASQPKPVALNAVHAILGPDEILIEYVLDEPHSFCIVVTKEAGRIVTLQAGSEEIQRITRLYLNELKSMRWGELFAAQLYGLLLDPIREVRHKTHLIISPDGILHSLPFEALRSTAGDFVVRTKVVSYVPSATVLRGLRQAASLRASRSLLAVGAVDYGFTRASHSGATANSSSAMVADLLGMSGAHFEDLPMSREEVLSLAQIAGGDSELLLGERATETAFKAETLSDFKVIHLAVHAVTYPQYPDRAALVLGRDPKTRDDGLLQVREIVHLALNADLVTLSACQTGVGPTEGEAGIVSLERAFLSAGARTVVASLWNVEDHSTTALMKSFYLHLAQHEDKAAALAHAKRDFLDHYGDISPYHWAGFVMIGEGSRTVSF